jgi:hypothetical protein
MIIIFWEMIIIIVTAVVTSNLTYFFSITKMNRLILFKEIIAVYCENHVKYTKTLGKMETY